MRITLSVLAVVVCASLVPLAGEEMPPPAGNGETGSQAEPTALMVIVQPGYPGSTEEAVDFMATLSGYIGKKMGFAGLSGAYYNDGAKALAVISERSPPFGIVSLGFYLKHRKELRLKALGYSKPKDNFVLLGRPGDVKDLAALDGQTVAGGPLYETEFLNRVIFGAEADVASWKAAPTAYSSRALRQLQRKEEDGSYRYRAVILTGREYGALRELPSAKALEKIFESDYYPPALLVVFGARGNAEGAKAATSRPLTQEEVEKLARTFQGLSEEAEGRQILEIMGAEGFQEVEAGWIATMEGKYDAVDEKK